MKVLMFGWEFPPLNQGGLGTACEGLVKSLVKKGIEITLVLPQNQEISVKDVKVLSPGKIIRVNSLLQAYQTMESYDIMHNNSGKPKLYGDNLFTEVIRYAQSVADIIKDQDFDIIHAHDWLTYKAGLLAKEISGKPLVVHMHATEFDRTGGNGVNQQVYDIEREGMHKADKVITVSNFTKDKVIEHYDVNPNKIEVVHNAVAFNNNDFRSTIEKQKQEPMVLFLGRITLQKGPDYFLQVAQRVLEYKKDVSFVMAGSGDMHGNLINHVASLDLGDKILFTGFLRGSDVDKMYQMADIYVMPSVSEPFGITPLEAMRNDIPVIISKQSGVSEVINHCLKVDFWDIDQTASHIISILQFNELRQELSENGKKEVFTLSWDVPADKCVNVYNNVLMEVSC
jgi:glycogen synthase